MRREQHQLRVLGGRPAIVARSDEYIRRQLWGRIVVVARADLAPSAEGMDAERGQRFLMVQEVPQTPARVPQMVLCRTGSRS